MMRHFQAIQLEVVEPEQTSNSGAFCCTNNG
jgi:hypothetical protein